MNTSVKTIVEYYGLPKSGNKCGMCEAASDDTSLSHGIWAFQLRVGHYKTMIDRGWRRCGCYLYKPVMDKTCCPHYTIRMLADRYEPNKSHRKVARRFHNFIKHIKSVSAAEDDQSHQTQSSKEECPTREGGKPGKSVQNIVNTKKDNKPPLSIAELLNTDNLRSVVGGRKFDVRFMSSEQVKADRQMFMAEYEVYKAYQMQVHGADDTDEAQFRRFLVESPLIVVAADGERAEDSEFGSFHHQYFVDNELLMVGIVDWLPDCLSSVYLFYNPKFAHLSPGTLSALFEIQLARQRSTDYYLGYYIHNCPKMWYKAQFKPSQLLCPVSYKYCDFDVKIRHMLDNSKFVQFADLSDVSHGNDLPPPGRSAGSDATSNERILIWLDTTRSVMPLSSIARYVRDDRAQVVRQSVAEFIELSGIQSVDDIVFRCATTAC